MVQPHPQPIMPKNTALLLIVWNILLSTLLGWSLMRSPVAAVTENSEDADDTFTVDPAPRDTGALKDARIAYFFMDSVQQRFDLVKEQGDRFRTEGRRLESDLQNEMAKAQKRYEQLMAKDHTYSTKAEIQADEAELQGLMGRIQGMQANSEERLARMEVEMLTKISGEIMEFLTEYNKKAGYDYIFSVQSGGQIWVGNPGLDISNDVVEGLNQRHRAARKAGK
jgi:outer membrane protein